MAAAKNQGDKDPVNFVHQNDILCETIKKENRTQKLFVNYGINPFKKSEPLNSFLPLWCHLDLDRGYASARFNLKNLRFGINIKIKARLVEMVFRWWNTEVSVYLIDLSRILNFGSVHWSTCRGFFGFWKKVIYRLEIGHQAQLEMLKRWI